MPLFPDRPCFEFKGSAASVNALAGDQVAQAAEVLGAGGAAVEVGVHARHPLVGPLAVMVDWEQYLAPWINDVTPAAPPPRCTWSA